MIIDKQGLVAFAFSFRIYDRRAFRLHDPGFETACHKHFLYKLRTFLQPYILRADTWLGNRGRKLGNAFVEILVEI